VSYPITDEDREVQSRARRLVDEELIPHEIEAELNGGELPPAVTERQKRRAQELGLTAINMPKRLGGAGLTTFQQALVQEQIGRVTNGLGWVVTTPAAWLVDVATPHQIETWIEPTIRGEREECYAITEEGAGSDVDAITATARRDGDDYVLNGEKWHVTSANVADHVFFQAKLAGGANGGSHALFIVDMDAPGLRVIRTPLYSHTLAHHHPILAFEDVRVPAANLVGGEGDGMSFVHEWFRYERLMIGARCCGAAARLIEETSAFAQERYAFGHPISEFQAVQFMLADSVAELWAARLMTYRTAQGVDEGIDVKVQHGQCSLVKLFASEMANRVADRAVQIFGGRGYMRENVAERFYRELRVDRIWEGPSEIQRVIIAQQLFKRGLGALIG
jgi:alkylation response protein AidB-like acyl-CoA dehydrogenase